MSSLTCGQSRRVLVIDDNPSIHEDFRKLLVPDEVADQLNDAAAAFFAEPPETFPSLRLELDCASQGESGVKLAATALASNQPYAVAFVDMRMPPGWDGLTTVRKLWEVDPQLQVVICSAYSDNSWWKIREHLGESDQLLILKKPFDNSEVLQLVTSLIEKRHLAEQSRLRTDELESAVEQRTQNLKEAKQASENLIAAIDSMLIGLDQTGAIIRWNKSAESLFGFSHEEILGLNIVDVPIAWDDSRAVLKLISDKTVRVETSFVDRSGSKRIVGLSSYPVLEANCHMGSLILGAELTEQRALEAQLHQARKLESIGQLAAGVAHEINTPMQYLGDNLDFVDRKLKKLGSILTLLNRLNVQPIGNEELLAELRLAAKQIEFTGFLDSVSSAISDSRDGVHHVSSIVRAMKDFAYPGLEEKSLVDINRALESTITVATHEWKQIANVVTAFDPTIPFVEALPVEINQVFLNILVNATHAIEDAMPKGEKGTVRISTRLDGTCVEVSIGDTGIGMTEAVRRRIFDPFFTTKGVGRGTGQGLSIAHSVIVSRHGGRIWCDSVPNKGTTFFIQIPVTSSERDLKGPRAHRSAANS